MNNLSTKLFRPENYVMAVAFGLGLAKFVVNHSLAAESPARPVVISVVATNLLPRYLTNIIQVSIPTNSFRDEFHTNWVESRLTNTLEVFKTNVVNMDEIRTNIVLSYRTNLKILTLTNWEPVLVMRTNWITQPVTNVVDFTNTILTETTLTNQIVAYRTNLRAFTLTNWESVLVMKTNWVTRPVTNVVEIDLSAPAPSEVKVPTPATASPEQSTRPQSLAVAASVNVTQPLEFELTHTAKSTKPDQLAIRLILTTAGEPGTILPVQEWRVEKVGGGVLMAGSRPEFTGVLPSGEYKVSARVRAEDGTTKNIRGSIEVKADASAVRSPATAPTTR